MHKFASSQIGAFPLSVIFKSFGIALLKRISEHPIKNLGTPSCKSWKVDTIKKQSCLKLKSLSTKIKNTSSHKVVITAIFIMLLGNSRYFRLIRLFNLVQKFLVDVITLSDVIQILQEPVRNRFVRVRKARFLRKKF